MHAARDKPTRVRSAGLPPGGGCGPSPCEPSPCEPGPCEPGSGGSGSRGARTAEGGRASSRSILASCSVRRVSCSSARLICSWACASPSSERAMSASWGLVSFGSGVEFIGVSLSVQCHPKVTGRPADGTPVLSKEWPYDGANGRMTEEHWIRWRGILQSGRPLPAAQRLCSSVPFLRADTMLRGTQYLPGIDRPAVRPSVASLGRRCGLGILGSSTSTFL